MQMHGSRLQEEYRKGTYDASEPQASFLSAADTEQQSSPLTLHFLHESVKSFTYRILMAEASRQSWWVQ